MSGLRQGQGKGIAAQMWGTKNRYRSSMLTYISSYPLLSYQLPTFELFLRSPRLRCCLIRCQLNIISSLLTFYISIMIYIPLLFHFILCLGRDGSSSAGYMFMCRVVNDPYDVLGCWYNDHFFLSGTMTVEGLNLLVSFFQTCLL